MKNQLHHAAQRKSPVWEGIKASAKPFAKGAFSGLFIGATVGVVTASLFALISVATGTTTDSLFTPLKELAQEGVDPKGLDGKMSEMNGFTGFRVQIFFNAIIVAGINAINNTTAAFSEAYHHAKLHNNALPHGQAPILGLAQQRAQTQEQQPPARELSKNVRSILEQGPTTSHREATAARLADDIANGKAAL